jgi:hypothetical protein
MASLEPGAAGINLRLAAEEVDVVASLAEGLAHRLEAVSAGEAPGSDEVIMRLVPRASYGDPEVDAELRAMLQADLLSSRSLRLLDLAQLLRDRTGSTGALDTVLDRDAAMRVVEALNDLRIGLAATIGYERVAAEAERMHDDDGEHERPDALRLLDALGWLQGGLIEFVDHSDHDSD